MLMVANCLEGPLGGAEASAKVLLDLVAELSACKGQNLVSVDTNGDLAGVCVTVSKASLELKSKRTEVTI